MIDEAIAGRELPEFVATVDRSQIRLFAKAIGETNPIHFAVEAATELGHRDLVAPPTLLVGLGAEDNSAIKVIMSAGGDYRTMLHGEQSFDYHRFAYAGDELRFRPRIGEVYSKKGGALQFVEQVVEVSDAATDEPVATMVMSLIFRNPGGKPQ